MGELISGLLSLPFRFGIPEPIFDCELPYISQRHKEAFVERGLEVWTPTTEQEIRYFRIRSEDEQLSNFDYLAFIMAKDTANSILLTGDKRLRLYASRHAVEVHGALWAIDEIHAAGALPPRALYRALILFDEDPTVWLPMEEHMSRLKKFRDLSLDRRGRTASFAAEVFQVSRVAPSGLTTCRLARTKRLFAIADEAE